MLRERTQPLLWHRSLTWALAAVVMLLLPFIAFGRAGGGEGYGGGGGGGGGGGDGDIGWLIYLLIRLCIYQPAIGIPLLLLVLAIVIASYGQGKRTYQGSVIRRGHAALSLNRQTDAAERLRAADPAFDQAAFFHRVKLAFTKIQQAWSQQNLTTVRPFISDGIHERFSLQFQEQRDAGWRNQLDDVLVQSVQIAELDSGRVFDVIHLRIAASAIDYRVSLADGRRISGPTAPAQFVEIWSFLRRRGAKTIPSKPGLIEGNCPNCGAGVEMNQSANCASCGAVLRSGVHDWVLAEITQPSEWSPTRPTTMPGVAEIEQADPQFNAQQLEDRASVIFWRRTLADRKGDLSPLRKMATDPFCRAYAERLRRENRRSFYGDCAVGSVRLLGILKADDMDRAVVEIRWSGHRYIISDDGHPQRTDDDLLTQSLYILGRRSGAKTDADRAISSAHCPGCGGPELDSAADRCEFCGTVLNDGTRDWVLMDILAPATRESQELLDRLRSGPAADVDGVATAPAAALAWMIQTMWADGHLADGETQLLQSVAGKRGLPPQQLQLMLNSAAHGHLEMRQPRDGEEARRWIEAMVAIALADGSIDKREVSLLHGVAARHGLGWYDVRMMLNRQRSGLYAGARQELKQQKMRANHS